MSRTSNLVQLNWPRSGRLVNTDVGNDLNHCVSNSAVTMDEETMIFQDQISIITIENGYGGRHSDLR